MDNDDRHERWGSGECQLAHNDCSERPRWRARTHVGQSVLICHMAWIQHHASLGDPYMTVAFERLP